jgi:hypothetical protein
MYSLGGANATLTTIYATCDKTCIPAETTAAASTGNLSTNRFGAGAAGNPGTAAYICGGATASTTYVNTGDKLNFANDTTSARSSANLTYLGEQLAALSERSSKAYFAGGLNSGGKVATANKLTFSTDTNAAQTSANLSSARSGVAGMNGNSSKGYFAGGTTGSVSNTVVTGEKLTFSSDTTAATASVNLSTKREQLEAGSDGSTKGYWVSGQIGFAINNIDKLTVSTDTTAAITATFYQYSGAGGSDGNKLLFLGGNTNVSSAVATGGKMTFATDAAATLSGSANLSQGRILPAGVTTVAL